MKADRMGISLRLYNKEQCNKHNHEETIAEMLKIFILIALKKRKRREGKFVPRVAIWNLLILF